MNAVIAQTVKLGGTVRSGSSEHVAPGFRPEAEAQGIVHQRATEGATDPGDDGQRACREHRVRPG